MELSRIRLNRRVVLEMLQRDIAPLAAFAGATLLIFLFAAVADEVKEGDTRSFDESVLLGLRTGDPADPIGPLWLEQAVVDITSLGGFAVLALVTLLRAAACSYSANGAAR